MRIIGGKDKGKKLTYVNSSITRPLRDLVKENIFNVIIHSKLIDIDINNSNVLDLYSGTGAFGIECISREAKSVTFVENDKMALEILNKNLEILSSERNKLVVSSKIDNFLTKINKNYDFDIIFFDPPYASTEYKKDLEYIGKHKIHAKKHIIILHREAKKDDDLTHVIKILFTRKYGRSKIFFGIFH